MFDKVLKSNLLLSATLIGFIGLSIMSALPVTATDNTPQNIKSCVPPDEVVRTELVAKISDNLNSYYLLDAYGSSNYTIPQNLVISVNRQNVCTRLFYDASGDGTVLSAFMPMEVAQKLELYVTRKTIKNFYGGNKQAYQQAIFDEARQQNEYKLSPEKIWVFNKLGIQIPPKTKVIDPKSLHP